MKITNENLNRVLIAVCITFLIFCDQCDGEKDKNKHKPPKHDPKNNKNDQQQHKHSTTGHHSNHTVSHNSTGGHAPDGPNPNNIGWSLHNDVGHSPNPNPHGYALQPHNQGHPDQSHAGAHHSPPQQPHPDQSYASPNPVAQTQGSGSAIGAGLGGLALGAIGGAAGGYFLSNALNSDGKAEEATTVSETTLTSLAAELNATTVEVASTVAENSSTAIEAKVASEVSAVASTVVESPSPDTLNIGVQKAPVEAGTLSTVQPSVEIKSEQTITAAEVTVPANTTDKNDSVIHKLSVNAFLLSVASSVIWFLQF